MNAGLSSGARAALFSLTQIQSQISATQSRLASGMKVNSALDNPHAFFAASSLNSRAGMLNNLTSRMVDAKSTIGAANNGIAALLTLLSSAKSIATQAQQSPAADLVTITGTNPGSFTTNSTIASFSGSSTRFRNNDTVTVSDGTTTATYTASSGDTVQTLLNEINNTAGLKVSASLANGKIVLAATENVDVTIGGSINGAGGGTLTSIIGHTAGATNFTPNASRASLAAQFDALVDQTKSIERAVGTLKLNAIAFEGSDSLDAPDKVFQ